MFEINTVETNEEVKELFEFLSSTFYRDAIKYNEYFYDMKDRLKEMIDQFKIDKSFLMYIKDNNKIIGGITGKNMNIKDSKITMSVLAVDEDYRNKGLGTLLIKEFENRCLEKNIKHIDLGSRFRATNLYLKNGYKYSLMVQVYDSCTIDDIRKCNKYNFKELSSYNSDTYGFIIYEVDSIKEEYINNFENNIFSSYVQYIFEKDL